GGDSPHARALRPREAGRASQSGARIADVQCAVARDHDVDGLAGCVPRADGVQEPAEPREIVALLQFESLLIRAVSDGAKLERPAVTSKLAEELPVGERLAPKCPVKRRAAAGRRHSNEAARWLVLTAPCVVTRG